MLQCHATQNCDAFLARLASRTRWWHSLQHENSTIPGTRRFSPVSVATTVNLLTDAQGSSESFPLANTRAGALSIRVMVEGSAPASAWQVQDIPIKQQQQRCSELALKTEVNSATRQVRNTRIC